MLGALDALLRCPLPDGEVTARTRAGAFLGMGSNFARGPMCALTHRWTDTAGSHRRCGADDEDKHGG